MKDPLHLKMTNFPDHNEIRQSRRNFVRGALGAATGIGLDVFTGHNSDAQEIFRCSLKSSRSNPASEFTDTQTRFFSSESPFFRSRANACVWTQPHHVDYLVSAMKELVGDMLSRA